MQQATGNGDALRLSLTQSTATFSQFGINTTRQVEDKVGTGRMQHLTQLVVGGIGLGQLQVVTDGTAHQCVALGYETRFASHLYLSA